MNIKNILKDLNISEVGIYEGDSYIIELDSSDNWGKLDSKLDAGWSKGILDFIDSESSVEEEGAVTTYEYTNSSERAKLILMADFDEDVYTLSIEPLEVD